MTKLSIRKIYSNSKGLECYTLQAGLFSVTVSTMGASIIDIFVPDWSGRVSNIVLGYKDYEDYRCGGAYFGATIGRYADKVSNAAFILRGKRYQLDSNDSQGNSLHGGSRGFSSRIWKVTEIRETPKLSIHFVLCSKNGDMGYPGNFEIGVTYVLTANGLLTIIFDTIGDDYCPVSLTNHTYFNLSSGDRILEHNIRLYSGQYLDIDNKGNYSGIILPVDNSPFDLREWTRIGDSIKVTNGFDHAYVLDDPSYSLKICAQITEPSTRRTIDLYSTYPVVLFYTGNHLDEKIRGRDVKSRIKFGGFCLEAEQYPDSMNHNNFPSAVQTPMVKYRNIISYLFGLY